MPWIPEGGTLRMRIAVSLAATLVLLLVAVASGLIYYNYRLLVDDIETEARRYLVVLSAVHTQSMVHRNTEEDGDPAIGVLNDTFDFLAHHEPGLSPWLVMGPKVVAYQRKRNALEIELARDEVDVEVLATGRAVSRMSADGVYRRTIPVVMGAAPADQRRCASCHAEKMGITRGELIGAYSIAIDARSRWTGFVDSAWLTLAAALGIAGIVTWLTARRMDRLAGKPLTRLTRAMARLAEGDLAIEIPDRGRSDEVGAMAGALKVFRDNAVRHREAEHTLRLLSQATEQSTSAVVITDSTGTIVYVNPMFTAIMGYRSDEVLGKNPSIFRSGSTRRHTYDDLWQHIGKGQPWHGEILDRHKDGREIWVGTTIAPVVDAAGQTTHFVSVYHDITERKAAEDRAAYLAFHDALTGLPNRALFNDRLLVALAGNERAGAQIAVLLLNLDNFSSINDTLGHATGDCLIRAVAERMRNADTVAAHSYNPSRLGGDEFAIILNGVDGEPGAGAAAERVLSFFATPFQAGEHTIHAKASIGIALSPNHGRNGQDLLRRADLALHAAKIDPRVNYLFFRDSMESDALHRSGLEQELADAIPNGQLWLAYQPQVDPRTHQVCGLEALLRWTHPRRGPISPALFIPVAENNRLIIGIGRWVIEEACRQMAAWRSAGHRLVPVAINLSSVQVDDPDLMADIGSALARHAIEPNLLPLEITESAFLQHSDAVSHLMREFMARGHRFVLDDFGTGYSSLSYLSRYPFSKIKIDQAFVRKIHQSPANAAIVRATVSLGHELGMRVTAEGVESPEELVVISESGVDEIQGYFFSKPLPAAEVPGFRVVVSGCPATEGG